MRLANKVAIVTGGGSGIGRASALLFAKEGAKVVIAQRTSATGEETATTINSLGGEAIFVRTDVAMESEVKHLVDIAWDKFGKVDILFNNAGLDPGQGMIEDITEALWDQVYAVNVKGIFFATKYAVPRMKKAGGGVIINTASMSGVRPRLYMATYASSKGAVIILTKALAIELAPYNIRVNCINPVLTETPMIRYLSDEEKRVKVGSIPLGRFAKPEDNAYAALYLASEEASMITGTCIDVDGGRHI